MIIKKEGLINHLPEVQWKNQTWKNCLTVTFRKQWVTFLILKSCCTVFFGLMYYTGRRGKEGLRNLSKDSFTIKRNANGKEYIEINFNKKTKRNQGDSLSGGTNALHNDHHVITEIEGSPLCPVQSYKKYLDLLNPDINAICQYPNKNKKGFTREVIGKNTLRVLMKDICEKDIH